MTYSIVAITACPTGVAHTYMAAEALKKGAQKRGDTIFVETQGASGAQNALTAEQIAGADLVIIAADTKVDLERFQGKPIYETSTSKAIRSLASVLDEAYAMIPTSSQSPKPTTEAQPAEDFDLSKAASLAAGHGKKVYTHLMTGVSHMIPLVIAGGIAIALSFAFGIEAFKQEGTMAHALMLIGGKSGFMLMLPFLSGYIAYSIADRPGLAPGAIAGALAGTLTAGFLGAIVGGFAAGYFSLFLKRWPKLPASLESLRPSLIIPVFASLGVGLLMIYVIGEPFAALQSFLTAKLQGLQAGSSLLLGLILGGMMAFDLGGPVNKAAYTFGTGLLAAQLYGPMAAVMASGMVPPLAIALAVGLSHLIKIKKPLFSEIERRSGLTTGVLGFAFITEGAIPYAAADPLRTLPALILGAMTTGALAMMWNTGLHVPHGGVFVLPIPHVVDGLPAYALAIVIGTVVGAIALLALRSTRKATA